MSARIKKLLVQVGGKPAGYLVATGTPGGGTKYSFTYLPDAGPEQALVRPVRCAPNGSVLTRGSPSSVAASWGKNDQIVRRY